MPSLKSTILKAGNVAFRCSIALTRKEPFATALLRHRFLFDEESRASSISRLRRELDWLQSNYKPVSVPELVDGIGRGQVQEKSLVYTTDDAHLDVFEVANEFTAAGVPLAVFVP